MKIVIPDKPIPKARPRVTKQFGTYNPQKKIMDDVRMQVKVQWKAKPLECAIGVVLAFYMPIPKSYNKKKRRLIEAGKLFHTNTPDLDNLEKFILDSMSGIVFKDDRQIVQSYSRKVYDKDPRTEVEIITGLNVDERI